MSLILLWIEMLAACVLFAATLVTVGLRRKSRKAGMALGAVGMFLPVVLIGMFVAMMAMAQFASAIKSNGFWWAVLMLGCYINATWVVRVKAAGRDEAGIRRADSWSVGRMGTMLLVVITLLVMTLWNMGLKAQVEIQALRAEAGAMALSVMPPQVADAANAARLYEQADERYKAATVPADEKVDDYRDLDPRSAEVTGYLERQGKTLEILRRAAEMPEYRPEYDYQQKSWEVELATQGRLRKWANLLAVAAKAEAAGGKADLALADCRRMYAVGAHANTPALLINGMVAVAIDTLASKTAAEVLPFVSSKGQLEGFAAPDPGAPRREVVQSLRGEEAFGLALYCDMGSGNYPPSFPGGMSASGGAAMWIWWLRDDVGFYREAFARVRKIAEQPFDKTAAERQEFEEDFHLGKRSVFGGIIAPELVKGLELAAETQAMRAAVGVALVATGYRLDHGAYPETAEALVPAYLEAVPLDPFDGKALRYKKNADGSVTIYAIGPNGKDDGGQIERRIDSRPLDTGIILRAAAKQG